MRHTPLVDSPHGRLTQGEDCEHLPPQPHGCRAPFPPDCAGGGSRRHDVAPGCVLPYLKPTYTVATNLFPAASAYYWLMQEKMPIGGQPRQGRRSS